MRAVELQFQVLEDFSQDQHHGVDRELVAHAVPLAPSDAAYAGIPTASAATIIIHRVIAWPPSHPILAVGYARFKAWLCHAASSDRYPIDCAPRISLPRGRLSTVITQAGRRHLRGKRRPAASRLRAREPASSFDRARGPGGRRPGLEMRPAISV
jgi:hypothetical protein